MQVNRSTGLTPFDLVLSRHPLSSVMGKLVSGPDAHDITTTPSPRAMKNEIHERIARMITHARDNFRIAMLRYKKHFDKGVRKRIRVEINDAVFLDKPLNYARTDVETLADTPNSKLQPKTHGPYRVIHVTPDTVTIDVANDIRETVPRVRVTPVTNRTNVRQPEDHANERTDVEKVEEAKPLLLPEVHGQNTAMRELEEAENTYVVERIVNHRFENSTPLYRVRWYGYRARDDTYEPAEKLLRNFFTRYWLRKTGSPQPLRPTSS